MRFQILSHAGLSTTSASGVNLLCDPWVVGSTYWRSWWNYPPVSPELIASLKPDYVYLTHIHWDHFQGPSLRKFDRSTPILVARAPNDRMVRDLNQIGFHNVIELGNGETIELGPGFRLTSYHFGVFLDSAVVIEGDGITMLNANDAKLMGPPLREVLRRHPRLDFVFRSHSSANSRLCYEVMDDPVRAVDDLTGYVRQFASFVRATGARYAIPFASNHCHLHPETMHFNASVTTPVMVQDYFKREGIADPKVVVMVSGDSWSQEDGFDVQGGDYFTNREQRIEEYRQQKAEKLEKHAALESRSVIKLEHMEKYFAKLFRALPFPVRYLFRGHPIAYVLTAGDRKYFFEVDLHQRTVRELQDVTDQSHRMQIHTAAFILRTCIASDLFSHLPISKRVRYRVASGEMKYMKAYNALFNFYEYDLLPVRRILRGRFVKAWFSRWREAMLYLQMATRVARRRKLVFEDYLPAPPRPPAGTLSPVETPAPNV
jgi:UDP-MurNAc hydroxylase